MSRNALKLIAAFALLFLSSASALAQPAATAAQKFSLRNPLGETIMLTAPPSGVTPYVLTFPPALGSVGQVLTINSTTGGLSWSTGAAGSVTSVGLSMPSIFSVSGSPVTSAGTLTATLVSQAANTVFAAPSGGAGVPSFRLLTGADITGAALTKTDDANVTLTLGGSPSTALLNATSLTLGWNGLLSIARGGTNSSAAPTDGGIAYGDGSAYQFTAVGSTGQVLSSNGTGIPSWVNANSVVTGSALTETDDPNIQVTLSGTPSTALLQSVNIDVDWAGVLSLARGGTNKNATASAGSVAYSDADSYEWTAVGSANQVLISNGTSAPSWSNVNSVITGSALTESDDANVQLTLTGTPGTALLQGVNIAAGWSGVLSTARGGTGLSAIGTAGQVLAVNAGATGLEYITPNAGTVTSFSSGNLSPLFTTSVATATTTPALSFNLNTQTANTVFAGPTGGGAVAPTFRSLVAADIPALSYVSSVALGNMSPLFTTSNAGTALAPSFTFSPVSQAANLVYASPSGGAGNPSFRSLVASDIPALSYVTSVGLALPVSVFSISGSPVTSSGTLTGSFVSQAANTVFAAPDGSAGTPSFRLLTGSDITGAALTKTDDANVTLTLGGSPSTALLNATSLTLGWTGQLSIARGGTNASTANDALNNLLPSQGGNSGKVLQTDGTNASWQTVSSGGSDWTLTGNSGTTAGTNFLGTTDAVDFVIKTGGSAASNERVRVDATGQVGFGNITPDVMVDINGAQSWRPGTLDLTIGRTEAGAANSHHDNVSIGDRSYFRVTDTATYYSNTITGFADGYNGKLLRIFNTTNTTLSFSVEDANSTAANRIVNTLGNNLSPGIIDSGFADFVYDATMSRWVVTDIGGPVSTATSGFTYFGRAVSDQTLTNATHGTTLQPATGISINILPNIVHTLDGMLYFTSSNSNVDVQIAFDVPNNFNLMKITILGHSDGGANVVDGSDILTGDNTASATINVTGGTEMFIQISGTYINGPSSGPLQLKFARAGGSADLVLKAGSYLRLIPVGTN